MLYKKNNTEKLDINLFKNPTSEYRGAPFWAWNCELESGELIRQIDCLKEMGLGGFHMHTRSGMATKYLSDEFMQLVKDCTAKAKKENMLAWLYDEDRWPSGSAGGFVTKNPAYRERKISFSANAPAKVYPKDEAIAKGTSYLLAVYDIRLNSSGELVSCRILNDGETPQGDVWYATVDPAKSHAPGWFNGEAYVDTLNPAAMARFVEITHEAYKKAVGEEFGKTVPAIFTDEPQFARKTALPFAHSKNTVYLPWTHDFAESYKETYGIDIIEKLPELFWELEGGKVSRARYCYHDHICERFTEAFSDQIGSWCKDNGIALTGHMMEECTLARQTAAIGEAMRAYRSFELPGIDMLCDLREYGTAKQAQSAVHQYGREGLMSELYGVTNWDFDFRGHKSQGDWQAALGVTARVHHLSWVSMKGSAKRDYPASINYQSPWYKEYSYIEDHFARLNTVLTRGKPCVRIGVIHPIESFWIHWGPADSTSDIRRQMDENFENLIEWMLFGTLDFDFISESCMPELCGKTGKKLTVGAMEYDAVLVPCCETLRSTTVEILNKFIDNGGKVVFAGNCPRYVDAAESDEAAKLYVRCEQIAFDKQSILGAFKSERDIEIKDSQGNTPEEFFCQLREDGDDKYLFIANARPIFDDYCKGSQLPTSAIISIRGEYTPRLLDTLTGNICDIDYDIKDGKTLVYYDFYEHDSLLLRLGAPTACGRHTPTKPGALVQKLDYKTSCEYKREEENVCVLDLARYRFNDESECQKEEILAIDKTIRERLGWSLADGQDVQPWVIEKEKITNFVTLYFDLYSEKETDTVYFCAEELEALELNGEPAELCDCGYFVDKSIRKYKLPGLKAGDNIITAVCPFGKRISLEACYLVGEFDVTVNGCEQIISPCRNKIAFGSIEHQGMPFYGGNLTYHRTVEITEPCDMEITVDKYIGSLVKVYIDGKDAGNIVFAPYKLTVKDMEPGVHSVDFKLFGNRYNTFGALHSCGTSAWYGPSLWYSVDASWCYEYNTKPTGIIKSPVIKLYKNR